MVDKKKVKNGGGSTGRRSAPRKSADPPSPRARKASGGKGPGPNEANLRAIINNIPDMAWLKDREGRYIAVNKPYGTTCGQDPADLVGRTDLDIWPKELAEAYRADDAEVGIAGFNLGEVLARCDHGAECGAGVPASAGIAAAFFDEGHA